MTKAGSAPMKEEKLDGKSSSGDAKTRLEEAASSSSSLYPEELQGFTSASEVYSVRVFYSTDTPAFL